MNPVNRTPPRRQRGGAQAKAICAMSSPSLETLAGLGRDVVPPAETYAAATYDPIDERTTYLPPSHCTATVRDSGAKISPANVDRELRARPRSTRIALASRRRPSALTRAPRTPASAQAIRKSMPFEATAGAAFGLVEVASSIGGPTAPASSMIAARTAYLPSTISYQATSDSVPLVAIDAVSCHRGTRAS